MGKAHGKQEPTIARPAVETELLTIVAAGLLGRRTAVTREGGTRAFYEWSKGSLQPAAEKSTRQQVSIGVDEFRFCCDHSKHR